MWFAMSTRLALVKMLSQRPTEVDKRAAAAATQAAPKPRCPARRPTVGNVGFTTVTGSFTEGGVTTSFAAKRTSTGK